VDLEVKIPVEVECAQEDEKSTEDDRPPKLNCQSTEGFRYGVMWNFFIMFFYEASLEISMSLVIGFRYIWARDSVAQPEESSSNALTLKVHRVSLYSFAVLFALSFLTVIIIMTRKAVTMETMKPRFGSLYDSLNYEGN